MSRTWPKVKVGEIVSPVERAEKVDGSKAYKLLGIRLYGNGPFLRETVAGTETAAKILFKVAPGDFIYSRLYAWGGAFGIISDELGGCYVSSEFPTFIAKENRVTAKYLKYWFRLPDTLRQVLEDCVGSTPLTRNRFKEEFFLKMEIPLPPIEEQNRIAAKIDELVAKISEAQGLKEVIVSNYESLLFSSYHQIADGAPRKPMGDVAPLNRRPVKVDIEKSYPQVSARSFGRGTFHKPPFMGSEVTWQKPFLVKSGDILISNIKSWEGAIAVAKPEDDGRVASHRYLTFLPIENVATSRFVCFHLLTPEGLHAVGEASPGSADRNRTLRPKAFLRIPIPVPPIEHQVWFEKLQIKIDTLKRIQVETKVEMDAMLPSILDRAFSGGL